MFLTVLSQQALQSLHWLPWSGAGHVRAPAAVVTVDVLGQLSTAG